ncbi:unnamed protein product [Gemmata massiliana]|uniref:Uncharacterized protein n=1 Tax=Gemmata massiliana TaxID=1210884 RepID=A0A6P2CSQ6_9BACT|nr:hypothetical protein [Gemmata massiliana]VTR91647.1 unnamed protein product [Gemmata massiliana]
MTPDRDDLLAPELRTAFVGLRTRLTAHLDPTGLDALAERCARAVRARVGAEVPVPTGAAVHEVAGREEPVALHPAPNSATAGATRSNTTDTAQFGNDAAHVSAPEPVVRAVLAASLERAVEQIVTGPGGEGAFPGLDAREAGARRALGRSVVARLLGTDRLPRAWATVVWPLVAGAIRGFLARRDEKQPGEPGVPAWSAVDRQWCAAVQTDPVGAEVLALRAFAGLSWDDIAVLTGRERSEAARAYQRVEHAVFAPRA